MTRFFFWSKSNDIDQIEKSCHCMWLTKNKN